MNGAGGEEDQRSRVNGRRVCTGEYTRADSAVDFQPCKLKAQRLGVLLQHTLWNSGIEPATPPAPWSTSGPVASSHRP